MTAEWDKFGKLRRLKELVFFRIDFLGWRSNEYDEFWNKKLIKKYLGRTIVQKMNIKISDFNKKLWKDKQDGVNVSYVHFIL